VAKLFDAGRQGINTSRAILTSFDLSAVGRQGGFIAAAHPIRALKGFPAMFRAFATEKGRYLENQAIRDRPNAPLYESSKLYLHDERDLSLDKMEEVYMSRWTKYIPGVIHSERAYTTFLNRLRADSFDAMAKTLNRRVTEPLTDKEAKAISQFINVATGRGDVAGIGGNAAANLNTVFFAPRYVLSRFQLLTGQPFVHGTARTRVLVATEYARALIGVGVVLGLGYMAGGSIELDVRSSDFGKIKFGNTRLDPLFGLQQAAVFIARLATAQTKTPRGQVTPLTGPGVKYGGQTLSDVITRFGRSKLAPVIAVPLDLRLGEDVAGQPVTLSSEAFRQLPLSYQDTYQAMQDQGIPAGAALGLLSTFGAGLQTYTPRPAKLKGQVKSSPVK
jgi:hypothetical protein